MPVELRAVVQISRLTLALALAVPLAARSRAARADDAPPPAEPVAPPPAEPVAAPAPELTVTVRARPTSRGGLKSRAGSKVDQRDIQERLPRSAPDALRYEPGVYVQQSAHGQGSPYIRGRTGQQTVVLFDGVRMNTSTWRQGPNQYFFTVDSQSLRSIEVTRGGASTLYGSDALAGVMDAHPMEPALTLGAGARVRPRASLRFGSADNEFGHRFQVDTQITERVRFLTGAGVRRAGRLEGGGAVRSPRTGEVPQVPALEEDGRTQLGTGFGELTLDGRFVVSPAPRHRIVAAAYAYRQLDSPRTDQCPPPYAPRDECLTYDEQFRSLAYLSFQGDLGPLARAARVAASYQRQHERRTFDRPGSFVQNGGRDDVDTLGLLLKATTDDVAPAPWALARLQWGGDVYLDWVDSRAWTAFTDIEALIPLSRGQYLAGSSYAQGGGFAQVEATLWERFVARAGLRGGAAAASAPADPASGTAPVDRAWPSVAANAGVEVQIVPPLALLGSYDRSFRAPNLDDLTSRQQSGPGFQFENPDLRPEIADTFEVGARLTHDDVEADVWVFRSVVRDAIARSFRSIADCPPATPQCATSWARFQLVNADGLSVIDGVELSARAWLPLDLTARATLAYAFGEGPNPQPRPANPSIAYEDRVPLSRVPPLNGTLEIRWDPRPLAYVGAALRWATLQARLAPTDRSDARIPDGGTPGYAVIDLRAGVRVERELIVSAVLENLLDAAYRVHGSSVNGPGRGIILSLEAGL